VPIEAVSFYNQTRNWWIIEGPTSSNLNYQTQEPLSCSEVHVVCVRLCSPRSGSDLFLSL
jgi:hypothetical protein